MKTAPAFFLSHGAPDFALHPGMLGEHLRRIGSTLRPLDAVLIVSAHWQTPNVQVMTAESPDTVHDFRGFDPALGTIQYPAPGDPENARAAAALLRLKGFQVSENPQRGRDHGAWVPLLHLLPEADIPVFQVSLPRHADTRTAFRMGRALAPLRRKGVAVIGSGSLTHNLYEALGQTPRDPEYAEAFSEWTRETLRSGDIAGLMDYRNRAPAAERSHPSEEHFLPLLVAAGAATPDEAAIRIPGDMTYGVLAMESYAWGLSTDRQQ